jgi:N-acetylglutamate synthase-like GNAT family acetyltransferase
MPDVTLRRATDRDLPALTQWAKRLALDRECLAAEQCLIAEVEGELVGFARLKPYDDGSLELGMLGVVPQHRGQGIARLLGEALLRRVPPGCDVWVTTDQPDLGRKFGFEIADDAPCTIREKAGRCCEEFGRTGVVIMRRSGSLRRN